MARRAVVPLLERDELIARLARLRDDAADGIGALVWVAGEAGAGKTSLVTEFARRCSDTTVVLAGACDPLHTPRPLGPLLDIESDRDAGFAVQEDTEPYALFAAVLDRLRSLLRPVVLVVEDVHWADDATLDFLRFVGRRVHDTNGQVIATYRDDEVGADHPLRSVLGQLAALPTTHRLSVPPLSIDAVATLAAGAALDPAALHALTGGNAFYVSEVVAGGTTLPATVQDAVLARVAQLPDGPRRVVEATAIAPRSLAVDHVAALVDATTADIDAAVESGVVLAERDRLHYRHEIARLAVEGSLPAGRQLDLHRRMLSVLEAADAVDLARLAHHAIRAVNRDKVAQYAPAAARLAARRGSHREAVALYKGALMHLGGDEAETIARLRLELADEMGLLDLHDDGYRQARQAADHYRDVGDVPKLAMALVKGSHHQWRTPDPLAAQASVDEAIALLEPSGPSVELAEALYVKSYAAMLARRRTVARAAIERAVALAASLGSDDQVRRFRLMEGTIEIVMGDARQGAAILTRVAEEARAAGHALGVNAALGMLGSGGGEARIYAEAIPALEGAIELGLSQDLDYTVAYSRSWLARIAFEQGRWDDALRLAEVVDRTSVSRVGIAMVTAMGVLGRVRVRRGDPGGNQLLQETLESGTRHELQHVWSPICGLAEHAWLAGGTEAPDVLVDGFRRGMDTDSPWARGELGFWMWRHGAIDGPPDGAAAPFAHHMAGDWRRAAQAWQAIGCPYEAGLALADGDESALLEAIAIFDALGARPAAGWARSRLRRLGVDSIPRGPSARTRANPAGLTARQFEVLGLMADGLSNGEIAERLFLSKKTVEHHVSAVLAKLGVDTRAKAIAAGRALVEK